MAFPFLWVISHAIDFKLILCFFITMLIIKPSPEIQSAHPPITPYKYCRRQIHLDFHTGPQCTQVGVKFDKAAFVRTLKNAHIQSMTVFAKCHHGFSYYPTKVGKMHPHLKFDLLGSQIAALHSIGARAPIYLSLIWDDQAGIDMGQYIITQKNGTQMIRPPLTNISPQTGNLGWTYMDPTSPYGDYLIAQVREICELYGSAVDGFFFDICWPVSNYSQWSQQRMIAEGINIEDDSEVQKFAKRKLYKFFNKLTRVIHELKSDATVFFNGTAGHQLNRVLEFNTHIEIESLPTGGWGYMSYPLSSRQIRTTNFNFLGMTGRFHKSWADFGGLKTVSQLTYEVGTIVAAGGLISIGDQMHPHGYLDEATYSLIGQCYSKIVELDPWLDDAIPDAEIALLAVGSMDPNEEDWKFENSAHLPDLQGAAQIFLEAGVQFDIVEVTTKWKDSYRTVVLPDGARIDTELKERIQKFIKNGGKLIVSGNGAALGIPEIPATRIGHVPTTPSYIVLNPPFPNQHPDISQSYPYVFYDTAHLVQPQPDAQTFGTLYSALFNRTWHHLTSHAHAPVGESLNAPLVVRNDSVLYFSAPIFTSYRNHDYHICARVALEAMKDWLPRRLILPRAAGFLEFSVHTQHRCRRKNIHMVSYHPRRSFQSTPHCDQEMGIAGAGFQLLDSESWGMPAKVYIAPDMQKILEFKMEGDYIDVDLPVIHVYTVICVEWNT